MNDKLAAIAEHMGWDNTYRDDDGNLFASELGEDNADGFWLAKLIQQKLVDEGWCVSIHQLSEPREPGKPFMAYGYRANGINICSKWMEAEPAAIVELAVKVWGMADAENK